jgi:hypothetical protein
MILCLALAAAQRLDYAFYDKALRRRLGIAK